MTGPHGDGRPRRRAHRTRLHSLVTGLDRPHRRMLTTVTFLVACIAIAVPLAASLPQPWSGVAADARDGTSRTLATGSDHPEFTGPHKYETLDAWNNLHTELGRSILEDGVVTPGELAEVRKAYNACLSVYGMQAKTITDGDGEPIGESVVPVRGSMDGLRRSAVIDQCRTESDYRWLEPLAGSQASGQPAKEPR